MSMNVGPNRSVMSEINVTPLVDVMLVLLVVFIVTAPLLTPQSLNIQLPKTEAVTKGEVPKQNQLAIAADGTLQFGGKLVSEEELSEIFLGLAKDPKASLQIMADEKVPYGKVAKIMAISQAKGLVKISLLTDQQKNKQ